MVNDDVMKARNEAKKIGYATYLFRQLKNEWDTPQKAIQSFFSFFLWVCISFAIFGSIFGTIDYMTYCNITMEANIGSTPIHYSDEGHKRSTINEWNEYIKSINENTYGMNINPHTQNITCTLQPKRAWQDLTT